MKCIIQIAVVLFTLLPGIAKAQWIFDIVSVEAYINGHKKQCSLLLARSTLEYSNKLLHEYSCKEIGDYEELNTDLDKYTHVSDAIDVMCRSLRMVLNVKNTHTSVSDRIGDYKSLLEDFSVRILKRGRTEFADTLIISINARGLRAITREGEQPYKSVGGPVLYATGAAVCSTSDLPMVLEAINHLLDNTKRRSNRVYFETWWYIQVYIGYWKAEVYCSRTMREILDDTFGHWRGAGKSGYQRQKERNMNRKLLLMAAAVIVTTVVHAQYVTYNHDSPKQGQVMVMETGTGVLPPDLYYSVLHNEYKKSAVAKNKLSFRILAGINLCNQVDEAGAIDSALTKWVKVEALNIADRRADIAWLAEGDKVSRQMDRFWHNIDRILLPDGTPADKERWMEYYHVYQCATSAMKDVYIPNAQRKKEYLRIHEDVVWQNEILVSYLAKRQDATAASILLSVTDNRTLHKDGIVRNAMSWWQESRLVVRGSQSGGNGSGGDDNESVNRGK